MFTNQSRYPTSQVKESLAAPRVAQAVPLQTQREEQGDGSAVTVGSDGKWSVYRGFTSNKWWCSMSKNGSITSVSKFPLKCWISRLTSCCSWSVLPKERHPDISAGFSWNFNSLIGIDPLKMVERGWIHKIMMDRFKSDRMRISSTSSERRVHNLPNTNMGYGKAIRISIPSQCGGSSEYSHGCLAGSSRQEMWSRRIGWSNRVRNSRSFLRNITWRGSSSNE